MREVWGAGERRIHLYTSRRRAGKAGGGGRRHADNEAGGLLRVIVTWCKGVSAGWEARKVMLRSHQRGLPDGRKVTRRSRQGGTLIEGTVEAFPGQFHARPSITLNLIRGSAFWAGEGSGIPNQVRDDGGCWVWA